MLVTDEPTGPWQKVGTDLCHLNDKDYLVIIDYHSNYPEIAQLSNTSAAGVITHMKSVFSRHGIPLFVISDNGPQYNCREFRKFLQDYGFQHITSSPLHPQGNGKAEKGVIKRLLKKSSDSGSDPYLALLSYCTTGMRERKATVLKEVSPRSYELQTDDGQVLRRNRKSLLKTQEQDSQKQGQDESDAGHQARETTDPHGVGKDALPNNTSSTHVLRRSTRTRRPPERLIEQG
uniref:Integrase catalytic domain-containing protein n=1 Tax=Xiphophorus maculatus TaxID=8083 RepID=A0A3B5RDT7_XIPMA